MAHDQAQDPAQDQAEDGHGNTMRVEMPDDMDTPPNLGRKRTRFLEDGLNTGVKVQRMLLSYYRRALMNSQREMANITEI